MACRHRNRAPDPWDFCREERRSAEWSRYPSQGQPVEPRRDWEELPHNPDEPRQGSRVARRVGRGLRPERRSRRPRPERRSRVLAAAVLLLVAIVIALIGVAAKSSAFDLAPPGTFKLLPITTTTS